VPAGESNVGDRVEALLAQIGEQGGGQAAATADELVRVLVEYYGGGFERVVELLGPESTFTLTKDPYVESLLLLHGLHPLSVDERIEQALDRVRPYLGSHAGGVAYLGVDDDEVAHLRLDGSCSGCPSSTVTVRMTIEEAVLGAAPELAGIEVEGAVDEPSAAPLLQIGLRPGAAAPTPVWRHPSALDLPASGSVSGLLLDGRPVVMARLGDTYYAYADACAACGGSLSGATLHGDVLSCPACAARFDVRLAGMSDDGSGRRLEPLPLLDDVSGIRVALVPETV
jgi:Fe-S cluster biogenesis protein NfuA/nitrite reductase/ring-hydroxylating ferredoxin subunit